MRRVDGRGGRRRRGRAARGHRVGGDALGQEETWVRAAGRRGRVRRREGGELLLRPGQRPQQVVRLLDLLHLHRPRRVSTEKSESSPPRCASVEAWSRKYMCEGES